MTLLSNCQAIISKEVSPIEDKKIYLLAELTICLDFEEVKASFKGALIPHLKSLAAKPYMPVCLSSHAV
jgi:hypothetical protein